MDLFCIAKKLFILGIFLFLFFTTLRPVSAHWATDIQHYATFTFDDDKIEIKYEIAPDTFVFDQFMVYLDTIDDSKIVESEARDLINKYGIPNMEIELNGKKLTPNFDAVEIGSEDVFYTGKTMITAYFTVRHVTFENDNNFKATIVPAIYDFPTQTITYFETFEKSQYYSLLDKQTEGENGYTFIAHFERKIKQTPGPTVTKQPEFSLLAFSQQQVDKIIETFNPNNPVYLVGALIFAAVSGFIHSLTPGHGKSIMTAYLIGTKRQKFKEIFILGSAVTFSHTFLIFVLGFLLLAFSNVISISSILPYFTLFASVIMLFLSVSLLRQSWEIFSHKAHENHVHSHGLITHSHEIDTEKVKKRMSTDKFSNWNIFLVGISGGLIPCAEALTLMIFAAKMGYTAFGLLLVLAFSLGLAAAIIMIGFLIMKGKEKVSHLEKYSRIFQIFIPAIIGLFILLYALYSFATTIPAIL